MSNRVQDYRYSLVAGVEQDVRITGFSAFTIKSTSAGSPVTVILDNGSYKASFVAGDGIDEMNLADMKLVSDVDQIVVLRASSGYQRTGQTVNVNATASVESGNSNPAIADVVVAPLSVAVLVGSNANRKAIVIRSLYENTGRVRVGSPLTVGAGSGYALDPDDQISLPSEGAVSVYNEHATDSQTISATEVEKV